MNAIDPNPRAVPGNNMPPADPFELCSQKVEDLYGEARLWLDGQPVESQAHADDLSNLLNMLRQAEKEAEAARKAEKEPHLEAGRQVDAKYKPLTDRCKLATDGIKKALTPWLERQEAEKRAAAEKARQEAEEKARAAQEAARAAREAADLAQAEEASRLADEAQKAQKVAAKAEKSHASASGGIGKAVSLRTVVEVELTDPNAAIRHYWSRAYPEFAALMTQLAERDARAGAREIPGFNVIEKKVAV
jgi:hypothetical protein